MCFSYSNPVLIRRLFPTNMSRQLQLTVALEQGRPTSLANSQGGLCLAEIFGGVPNLSGLKKQFPAHGVFSLQLVPLMYLELQVCAGSLAPRAIDLKVQRQHW